MATVRRCRTCPRALKRRETDQCVDCRAVDASLRGLGPLRKHPVVQPADLPSTAWCVFCQRANTPEYTDAMYRHDEGRWGTRWGHVGCETQRAWDEVEHRRDMREMDPDRDPEADRWA